MTTDDHSGVGRSAPGEEPADAVPEADAAEQYTVASSEEGDWLTEAQDQPLDQAAEADVVEQLQDAGDDDEDEWR